jgi:hypothetical protein
MSCVAVPCCTTRRHDTHSIGPRELRYPWHPWHGQPVFIRGVSERGGRAVFHCSLDASPGVRLLEIPQWMFDAAAVCLIRLSASPVSSCEALRELRELIGPHRAVGIREVVQAQHQSLTHTGGSDAKPSQATPSMPTDLVPSTGGSASLGESATRSSAPSLGAARETTTRRGPTRRAGRLRGAR